MAIAAALLALSGCGGDDDDEQTASGAIGEPRLATNGKTDGLIRKPEQGPGDEVVEGEPPPMERPPAAVGAPRRSCSGGGLTPTAGNSGQIAGATLCLLNAERQTRGLRPLRSDRRLARAALAHSRDMVRRSYFSHDSRSGASFIDRIRRAGYFQGALRWTVGENLAWGGGSRSSPRAIVASWMNSPGHRANILQGRFREIGIGIALGAPRGSRGSSAATYSTEFGMRRRAT